MAAMAVIYEYIGGNFVSDEGIDPFVESPFTVRIRSIGEWLFLIRSTAAFGEFCRRFKEDGPRATYYELLAAKQFCAAGFSIEARQRTGTRGEDFDFWATRITGFWPWRRVEKINVEITALTTPHFASKTVMDRLNYKRRQVPKTEPAVIFCVFPEVWPQQADDFPFELGRIADEFFSRHTKRINVVVFLWEEHVSYDAGGGVLMVRRRSFVHPTPRNPTKRPLDFLLFGSPMSATIDAAKSSREDIISLRENFEDNEFYRWVNGIVPQVGIAQ